jgi:hypothetical protein
VRVDHPIHEAPRERECVDQDALGILFDHEVAEDPDKADTYYIGDNSSFVADFVHDLRHHQ